MTWFQWLGSGGVAALVSLVMLWPQIQKARADAGKARVDAAVAEDTAEDAHWQAIVTAQTEAVVKPLREEVERLSRKVTSLEERVEQISQRYRSAIGYVRILLAWIRRHHQTDHPMDLPVAPAEIAGDI